MSHDTLEGEMEDLLRVLGIESLCQWDVLVFLYRHRTSLIGADHFARLLGYEIEPVVAAFDVLERLGFVERSRVSQGARLYKFTLPPEPRLREAFERLLVLADRRSGRLFVSNRLRGEETAQKLLHESSSFECGSEATVPMVQGSTAQVDQGCAIWLKAI